MKKLLLVYLPFCTPASPPYSITNMYSFLKNNSSAEIDILDLNLEFHKLKFSKYQKYFQNSESWKDYEEVSKEYHRDTHKVYSENNKLVVANKKPEFFDELLDKITSRKPDTVAFSIVYSSQAFFVASMLKELKNVTTVIGGPAINSKLKKLADKTLNNELELLNFIEGNVEHDALNFNTVPDFSIYDLGSYFTPSPVIPLKTSSTCYYQQCTFCSHYSKVPYIESSLDLIKETILKSKQRYFFLIDDMIPKKRLLDLARLFTPLKIKWSCQLKPSKQLDLKTLKILKDSGLDLIIWGLESGNQRILDLMKKGTSIEDITSSLTNSHEAGIKNTVYVMFGFPTETQEEFKDTRDLLVKNEKCIDLISVSIFGLQKGTPVYNNPKLFGITKIIEEERTVLEPRITYEVSKGLSQKQATKLKNNHKKTFDRINKYPQAMNFFREHMLCVVE
ncbi:radical SAM protein [Candidatus Woesearchaeota archaeon]|nr:radical SAM protein [Candidatus Woesearchaeota archaeon]